MTKKKDIIEKFSKSIEDLNQKINEHSAQDNPKQTHQIDMLNVLTNNVINSKGELEERIVFYKAIDKNNKENINAFVFLASELDSNILEKIQNYSNENNMIFQLKTFKLLKTRTQIFKPIIKSKDD